jgi:hypothetical protein
MSDNEYFVQCEHRLGAEVTREVLQDLRVKYVVYLDNNIIPDILYLFDNPHVIKSVVEDVTQEQGTILFARKVMMRYTVAYICTEDLIATLPKWVDLTGPGILRLGRLLGPHVSLSILDKCVDIIRKQDSVHLVTYSKELFDVVERVERFRLE